MSIASKFVNFINNSPSPYHAVSECKSLLTAAGFKELRETSQWNITPGSKYFVTRNHSMLFAFAVGGQYRPGNGFTVSVAHTDSPCPKVKPVSSKEKHGFLQLAVQVYGGGIWHTWFDRNLKLAGRVVLKSGSKIVPKLVHIDKPLLCIPNLCIHLQRDMNDKFSPNPETHLMPILASSLKAKLEEKSKDEIVASLPDTACSDPSATVRHHPLLIRAIADELDVAVGDILDFDLCLSDYNPACIGGLLEEFIHAPRLDNLFNVYTATQGLIDSDSLEDDPNIRVVACYDNEECGSVSAQGAGSRVTESLLRRLACCPGADLFEVAACGPGADLFEVAVAKSCLLSADQSHAVHPNYPEKHEDNHKPVFHGGIVVKSNANQRYSTTELTASIVRLVAEKAGVPIQEFCVKNDTMCGSTVGPILSAKLGMRTVDIGGAQLSMHSIREMCSTSSVEHALKLYIAWNEYYPVLFQKMDECFM